jgi:hypothetical protein
MQLRSPPREPVQLASKMRVKTYFAGTGEVEITGVGESTTTVVTKVVFAGADDVAITGVSVWVYDGVADDPGTGTIGLLLRGVTPVCLPVSLMRPIPVCLPD